MVRELIIAGTSRYVRPGDEAFVEAGRPGHELTYGSVLTRDDCERIDDTAYSVARGWYRSPDGADLSVVDGVSIGRCMEHPVVLRLVSHLRASCVLRSLVDGRPIRLVLRGAGSGWQSAASVLGLDIGADSLDPGGPPPVPVRRRGERYLHWLLTNRRARAELVLINPTGWAMHDYVGLARRATSVILNPGRRLPLVLALHRKASILRRVAPSESAPVAGLSELALRQPLGIVIEPVVRGISGIVKRAADESMHAEAGAKIAISTEDASPGARASMLAARSLGIRTVTLEHGISGSYRHQVESVSDALAVWGKPQAKYHATRQSVALPVVIGATRMEHLWQKGPTMERAYDAVFFTQPAPPLSAGSWPEDQIRAWDALDEVARNRPEWRIGAKVHPASSAYASEPQSGGSIELITGRSDRIIRAARVVIVVTSTAGAEAMAAGVPVVQLLPSGLTGEPSLLAGGALVVAGADELGNVLNDLLTDAAILARATEAARSHAEALVDGIAEPGHAFRRLEELIDNLS